ncbi:MAG: LPS assembly lipoprotein LptE [Plesiomonas sp.]|uniref:LPS assembly lipoprotein LptE n=1 Tax=Plesiomonas sp. TaxID=2486279 RepID=UPI003EE7FEE9
MLKHLRFKPLMLILTVVALAATAGCGFHLRGTTQIPTNLQTMTLQSYDPYGPLTRAMREQMLLNNITLVKEQEAGSDIPTFRLNSAGQGDVVSSVFSNGIAAEKNITLTVNASVLVPGQDVYPLSVQVARSFFDNPNTALAKSAEEALLRDEMYQEAARRLMIKLLTIHPKSVSTPSTPETRK